GRFFAGLGFVGRLVEVVPGFVVGVALDAGGPGRWGAARGGPGALGGRLLLRAVAVAEREGPAAIARERCRGVAAPAFVLAAGHSHDAGAGAVLDEQPLRVVRPLDGDAT